MEVEMLHEAGQFSGLFGPLKSTGSLCCGVGSKRDHSVVKRDKRHDSATATADWDAPDWTVSYYIVLRRLLQPFVKILWPLVFFLSAKPPHIRLITTDIVWLSIMHLFYIIISSFVKCQMRLKSWKLFFVIYRKWALLTDGFCEVIALAL